MTKKKAALRVEDIMSTELVTLRESDSLAQAAREMRTCAIRHVLVVDPLLRLIGMIFSEQLLDTASSDDRPISSLMKSVQHTVGPRTLAQEAVGILIDCKIDVLPVVDYQGEVIGILTATDFLVIAHQALTGDPLSREVGEL